MSDVIPLEPLVAATEQTVTVLGTGDVAVAPTDTVYAVVADAFNPTATNRVFSLLRRGRDVPLPVLIRSPRQVVGLVDDVPEAADRLMASYWPGPLTLVFRAADGLTWDLGDSWGTVSLRMPADDLLLAVIAEIGPIAATGVPAAAGGAADLDELRASLGDEVDLYVDGGERTGAASTIVDVSRGHAEVLREGAISTADIVAVADGTVGWGERPQPAAAAAPARSSRVAPPEATDDPMPDEDAAPPSQTSPTQTPPSQTPPSQTPPSQTQAQER